MKIVDLSIKRSVTTMMMVLLVVLLGVISLSRLHLDLFPNMSFPMAAVITDYNGVGPHEIETMVTRPLENVLATVTNIKSISSVSSAGQSMVLVEFNWGTDMNFATLGMREKIDLIKRMLPEDVGNPMVVKFDPSLMPMMQLGVSGEEDLVALKDLVEKKIIPRIERLEGVASVGLTGGLNREILIELDQSKLNSYGVSTSTITQTLMLENMNLSGGEITRGQMVLLIRTTGKFTSIEEIRELRIQSATGLVALKELAEIKDTYKEVTSIARMNGLASVGLTIQKQTDANTVQVSRLVSKELELLKTELAGLEIVPVMDQAKYIEQSIGNVQSNAIIGGLLAILVLYLFLRNLRSTIIIATAIPISVITTFTLIYFGGLTLNMMTLGGLALGIGMLVDNAIVVLENIYRYRQEGAGKIEAASQGTQEVSMAIVASTLTTVIVFLPVVFVEGLTSQLFKELALTITFSLLASLVVALTVIPMLSSKLLKISKREQMIHGEAKGILKWVLNMYRATLNWALDHRFLTIVILILVLGASAAIYPFIGSEFIPEMDQGEFTIDINLPIGTILDETAQVIYQIEDQVMAIPEVETVFTNVGSAGMIFGSAGTEVGSLTVRLKNFKERERSTAQIMEELRTNLRIPDAEINIEAVSSFGAGMAGGAPISIKIKGTDLQVLEELTQLVKAEISQVPGVREVKDTISEGRPEMQIHIDRELAAQFGLRVTQIASSVKTAIQGDVATRYEVGGREYDIRVRMKASDRESINEVKNLLIPSPVGAKVPLSRIADFTIDQGPRSIQRENQVRYVEITANLFEADLGTVVADIQSRIKANVAVPDEYELDYTGQYEEMVNSFSSLYFALILAVILVYMVLASQFESLLYPLVIMFTVPLAAIGVLWGLFLTGNRLSVPSYIGMIMLAGIVVNNAIVLVDYINTLRERGHTLREAIVEAGPTRLRPIMMTALTTILGLLPLAMGIGEGSEVQAPMAVVVISGLLCATILTLYVVPVFYSILTGFSRWFKNLFRSKTEEVELIS